MKILIPIAILLPFTLLGCSHRGMTETSAPQRSEPGSSSPALTNYTQTTLLGDVWSRPQLSKRDRSVIPFPYSSREINRLRCFFI